MEKLFYVVIGGCVLGVLWHSFFDFGVWFSVFVLGLGALILCTLCVLKNKRSILLVGVLIVSISFGLLRYDIANLHQGSVLVDSLVNQTVVAEGVVIDEPDVRDNNTNYTIRLHSVFDEEVSEKVRVVTSSYPQLAYGDAVLLLGELEKPKGFRTDTGKYFDYASFLSKDDIFYQMIFPQLEFISSGHGGFVKQYLFTFKNAFLSRLQKLIPDPQVSLLGGLILGAKQSLGEKLQEDFRTTGIIHIVVLSGFNVTIVALAIMYMFAFLPRMFGLSLGVLGIILFAIITGGSATVVRASIMVLFVLLAKASGRTYDMARALLLAGFLMVLHNPKILLNDASFQLSFLATLGLIVLAPKLEVYARFVPTWWHLREFATATVATQIFVLPLLLYKIGELSLVALPVNLLVLITVPITMLFGFLAGVISFVSGFLAIPFAFVAYTFLSYQLKVVELFANIPFASVQINVFPLWLMLGFYLVYGLVLWKIYKKTALLTEAVQVV